MLKNMKCKKGSEEECTPIKPISADSLTDWWLASGGEESRGCVRCLPNQPPEIVVSRLSFRVLSRGIFISPHLLFGVVVRSRAGRVQYMSAARAPDTRPTHGRPHVPYPPRSLSPCAGCLFVSAFGRRRSIQCGVPCAGLWLTSTLRCEILVDCLCELCAPSTAVPPCTSFLRSRRARCSQTKESMWSLQASLLARARDLAVYYPLPAPTRCARRAFRPRLAACSSYTDGPPSSGTHRLRASPCRFSVAVRLRLSLILSTCLLPRLPPPPAAPPTRPPPRMVQHGRKVQSVRVCRLSIRLKSMRLHRRDRLEPRRGERRMRGQLPLRTLIDRCPSPLLPPRFAALLCALPSWAACSCASASVPTRYIWAHGEVSVGARM